MAPAGLRRLRIHSASPRLSSFPAMMMANRAVTGETSSKGGHAMNENPRGSPEEGLCRAATAKILLWMT